MDVTDPILQQALCQYVSFGQYSSTMAADGSATTTCTPGAQALLAYLAGVLTADQSAEGRSVSRRLICLWHDLWQTGGCRRHPQAALAEGAAGTVQSLGGDAGAAVATAVTAGEPGAGGAGRPGVPEAPTGGAPTVAEKVG